LSIKELLQELLDSNNSKLVMTEKQLNIICAAIELFSEKGFAATSTSEIAKRAGVAEGTIFRHYKTKKDLLLAIPDCIVELQISKTFFTQLDNILEQPNVSFEKFLRAVISNRKDFASSNMVLIKIIFQELPFHPDLRLKMTESLFKPAKEKLVKIIDYFKDQGQIKDLPSKTILNFIFTTIFGYMFTCYIAQLDLDWNIEKETENLVRYIMNGLCKPASPTSEFS